MSGLTRDAASPAAHAAYADSPLQQRAADQYGLATDHKLPALAFDARFEEALPGIVAPDAG